MGNKLPAWLDKLRAANGTDENPNTDPLVNYFNYTPAATKKPAATDRRSFEALAISPDEYDFDPFECDDDFDRLFSRRNTRAVDRTVHDVTDELDQIKKSIDDQLNIACMIKCNLSGTPILHSLSELARHGDRLLNSILTVKTGATWANGSDGVGKTFERQDTVFIDRTGYSELYCVATAVGDACETVFRVTVGRGFCAILIAVTDDEIIKQVMEIYKNKF